MDDSSFNSDISVVTLQECPPQGRNIYGSVVSAYFRSDIILFDEYSRFTFQLTFRRLLIHFIRLQSLNQRKKQQQMFVNQLAKNQIDVFVIVNPLVKPSRRMESAVVVLVARQIFRVCRTDVNVALVENNARIR